MGLTKSLGNFLSDHSSRLATTAVLLFHAIGLLGLWLFRDQFAKATPAHLLLMFLLFIWTARADTRFFPILILVTAIFGLVVEFIGVHTALLFGHYTSGETLGPSSYGIPWLIGANWVIVVSGAASLSAQLLSAFRLSRTIWMIVAAVFAGCLATGLDFLIEPIAVKLDYWSWRGGMIPSYNYLCWLLISSALAIFWLVWMRRPNQFAVNLFFIQVLFFLLLHFIL